MTPSSDPPISPAPEEEHLAGLESPPPAPEGPEAPAPTDVEMARHRARRRLAVIAACLAVTLVLAFDVATGLDSPARPLLSVAFYLSVPGWALVGWLDLEDEILCWTLAIGLSVAIGILAAEVMLWAHAWNPDAAFSCLAYTAAVLLEGQAVRLGPTARAARGNGAAS